MRLTSLLQEIKTTRKCPLHRKEEFHKERDRLRRLLYDEENIEVNVPTVPDLIQDFPATHEQIAVCERHLGCARIGAQSNLGEIIKSWSGEQRGYYGRQKAQLKKFPKIFSGERAKW